MPPPAAALLPLSSSLLSRLRTTLEMSAIQCEQQGRTDPNEETLAKDLFSSRDFVRAVAVEVEACIAQLGIPQGQEDRFSVPMSVAMPESTYGRHQRDWIFYREARNVLEFIRDAFEQMASSSAAGRN